jgi:hypothetical protein
MIAAFQSGDAQLLRSTLEDFKKFSSYFECLNRKSIGPKKGGS